jgi:hypothetical protein
MAEAEGTGRFPMPTVRWITAQLPEELYPLFGFRGEAVPEVARDVVEYLYVLKYPDDTEYRMPILAHYVPEGDPAVAFIIDDEIHLDDVRLVVKEYTSREVKPGGGDPGYTYHQVTVALPEEGGDG